MSNAIQAVQYLINSYEPNTELAAAISKVFESNADFLDKGKQFDQLFTQHPGHGAIQEYAFDLMMAHHLEHHNGDEDYFDSAEWQEIEDQTLERGTEFLNILLYISEAQDADAPMEIEDFLYEFLLVDEDEFQDEHRIYEELIANQDLIEEHINSIVEVAKRLPDELEIRELFVPLLLFFKEPDNKVVTKEYQSKLTKAEYALLSSLLAYTNK